MHEVHSLPLFEFSPYLDNREESLTLIRQFAAHDAFRSAVVEELELDEDFYRRPLRPEDLTFLTFETPVRAETVSRLPALATQRLLLSINELDVARLPRAGMRRNSHASRSSTVIATAYWALGSGPSSSIMPSTS
jgi:hypothetical protein